MTDLTETLSAQLVRRLYESCLADNCDATQFYDVKDEALVDDNHFIRSINGDGHIFSCEKLLEHSDEIENALLQLPAGFMNSINEDGESFMHAVFNKNGTQWGELYDADILVTLGRALGIADYCVDQAYWEFLPGRVPFIVVYDEEEEEEDNAHTEINDIRNITDECDRAGNALANMTMPLSILYIVSIAGAIPLFFFSAPAAFLFLFVTCALTTLYGSSTRYYEKALKEAKKGQITDSEGKVIAVKGDTIGDPFKDIRSTLGR